MMATEDSSGGLRLGAVMDEPSQPGLVRRFSWTEAVSDDFRAQVLLELNRIERFITRLTGHYGLYRSDQGKPSRVWHRLAGWNIVGFLFTVCLLANGVWVCVRTMNVPEEFWPATVILFLTFAILVFDVCEMSSGFCSRWKEIVEPLCRGEEELAYLRRLHSLRVWLSQVCSPENRLPTESAVFLFCFNNLVVLGPLLSCGLPVMTAIGIFVFKIQGYRNVLCFFWPESDLVVGVSLLGMALIGTGRGVALHVAWGMCPLICNNFLRLERLMDPETKSFRQLQQEYAGFVDAQKRFFRTYSLIWNGYAVGFAVSVPFFLYVLLFHSSGNGGLFLCNLSVSLFIFYALFCVLYPPAWCFATFARILDRVSGASQYKLEHGRDVEAGLQSRQLELMERTALLQQFSASKPSLMFMNVHIVNYQFIAYYLEMLMGLMLLIRTMHG